MFWFFTLMRSYFICTVGSYYVRRCPVIIRPPTHTNKWSSRLTHFSAHILNDDGSCFAYNLFLKIFQEEAPTRKRGFSYIACIPCRSKDHWNKPLVMTSLWIYTSRFKYCWPVVKRLHVPFVTKPFFLQKLLMLIIYIFIYIWCSCNHEINHEIPNRGWAVFLFTRYGLLSLTKNTL